MSFTIGDATPIYPASDYIKSGTLLVGLQSPCRTLQTIDDTLPPWSTIIKQFALAGNRTAATISALEQGKLEVVNASELVTGNPFALKVRRIRCPWGKHKGVTINGKVDFFEDMAAADDNRAPTKNYTQQWFRDVTPFTYTVTSNATPMAQPGSNGPWSASIKLERIPTGDDCDNVVRVTGTLLSGGYDFLAGQSVVQSVDVDCGPGIPDGPFWSVQFFWQGVGPFGVGGFPPSIGLRRGLTVVVTGGGYFD